MADGRVSDYTNERPFWVGVALGAPAVYMFERVTAR